MRWLLWKILKEMGIPDHLTCLLRNLYADQEATVRTGHGTTDWFQIGKGPSRARTLEAGERWARLAEVYLLSQLLKRFKYAIVNHTGAVWAVVALSSFTDWLDCSNHKMALAQV